MQRRRCHLDGVDSDEALAVILHEGLEAHRLEAIPQHVVHGLMPLPLLLQALLGCDGQGLPHGIPTSIHHTHPMCFGNAIDQ